MKKLLVCDDCGTEIIDTCQGELAWDYRNEPEKQILVVHAPNACPRWMHTTLVLPRDVYERSRMKLDYFMGDEGRLELIARIENEDIAVAMGLELMRRLHVAGYEQYRLHREKYHLDGPGINLPAKPNRLAFCKYLALDNLSGCFERES